MLNDLLWLSTARSCLSWPPRWRSAFRPGSAWPEAQGERPAGIVAGPEVRLGGDPARSQWEASLVVDPKNPKRLLVCCIVDPPRDLAILPSIGSGARPAYDFGILLRGRGATWKSFEFARDGLFEPVIAFGPAGEAYLAYMRSVRDAGMPSTLVSLHRSDDGGQSWGPQVTLSEKGDNADHPMIAVDCTGGRFAGRVYVRAYSKEGVVVHRSATAGQTFQTAVPLPDWSNRHVYVHNLLVLGDGTLAGRPHGRCLPDLHT